MSDDDEFVFPEMTGAVPKPSELDQYRHYLDDSDLTEDQKTEYLKTLWQVMEAFASMAWGTHPVQQAQAARERDELLREASKPQKPRRPTKRAGKA